MDGSENLGDDVRTAPGYQAAGRHSAVKVCRWTADALTGGKGCYKSTFYGIQSHRCLQMSPAADACNLHCRFCWRDQSWEYDDSPPDFDAPESVLERSVDAQRRLLSGYGGDSRVKVTRLQEALEPRHVAISLTGEPTLYPKLSEYLQLCHERGMTTFLVTNGTHPEAVRALDPLPTQLYVSVTAPNREVFQRLTHPSGEDAWDRLKETLGIVRTLDTRRVLRHTLVKGWNMGWEDQYARLDSIALPDFIEVKGYAFMGRSRHRLSRENVPSLVEVRAFAHRLAKLLGFEEAETSEEASVVLLARGSRPRFLDGFGPDAKENGC